MNKKAKIVTSSSLVGTEEIAKEQLEPRSSSYSRPSRKKVGTEEIAKEQLELPEVRVGRGVERSSNRGNCERAIGTVAS